MGSENSSDSFSKERAELFEALGHPTRIKILELLANSPQSFSDLKKALDIDSSGQLQFHLQKLQGLIKTDPEGNYALTDEGKEALRVITLKSQTEPLPKKRLTRKKKYVTFLTVIIAIFVTVAVLSAFVVAAYSPLTINVKSSASYYEQGDQQQYFNWIITGHLPGQSFQTLQFSVKEYINGNFTVGYGDAVNSPVQTDAFGNFIIGDPHVLNSIPANYSIGITLVSENGVTMEKMINIPENYTLQQILG
jgi:DNA-binding transcriptional ArsR family regulator